MTIKNTTDKNEQLSRRVADYTLFISRPTSRLLSFALCLEWINGIYNTPDTGCLQ